MDNQLFAGEDYFQSDCDELRTQRCTRHCKFASGFGRLQGKGKTGAEILVYFLNPRWRWCRFASSILKTRQLALHTLVLELNFMVLLDEKCTIFNKIY